MWFYLDMKLISGQTEQNRGRPESEATVSDEQLIVDEFTKGSQDTKCLGMMIGGDSMTTPSAGVASSANLASQRFWLVNRPSVTRHLTFQLHRYIAILTNASCTCEIYIQLSFPFVGHTTTFCPACCSHVVKLCGIETQGVLNPLHLVRPCASQLTWGPL